MKLAWALITGNSNRPLHFAIKTGIAVSVASAVFICYVVIRKMIVNDFDMGWSSLIASIYLMGGALLSAIGVVGVYIGNIFNEIKDRPHYVIQEVKNGDERE